MEKRQKGMIVGDTFYATKKEVLTLLQTIFYAYPLYEKINLETHEDDFLLLLGVLENHPRKEAKIGCGIAFFYIGLNPLFPGKRMLYLVRTDATEEDWSFMKCLTPPPYARLVSAALRREVVRECITFKKKFFSKRSIRTCPILHIKIDKSTSHVDHIPPNTFECLVLRFLQQECVTFEDIKLHSAYDGVGYLLSSPELSHKWRAFHKKNARLRVISKKANLSNVKKQGILSKKKNPLFHKNVS